MQRKNADRKTILYNKITKNTEDGILQAVGKLMSCTNNNDNVMLLYNHDAWFVELFCYS